jgi:Mn2+/Fe2+ NRAMP family transporter
MLKKIFKNIGPGPLIAAAFIGPGTITISSIAGASFGYALIWAMVLSTFITILIQEMSARIGLVTGMSLAEIIRQHSGSKLKKLIFSTVVFSAIIIGNAAYEAGNISGAVIGVESSIEPIIYDLFELKVNIISLSIGLIAIILLATSSYKTIEKVLIALVIIMSISFILSAVITRPDIIEIMKGALTPTLPKDATLIVVGLIGTTVVPYNIFLHSSLVNEKWKGVENLKRAKIDSLIAIILGGIISISIIITAASVKGMEISDAQGLAKGLEPLFGEFSKIAISIGLFAAGITSAVTAPLAAAYVSSGLFGWKKGIKSKKFKLVWFSIIAIGLLFSSLGIKPIEVIKFAQIANGLLLPLIAMFLVWSVNQKNILGDYTNSRITNLLAFLVILITAFLGIKSILNVFGVDLMS